MGWKNKEELLISEFSDIYSQLADPEVFVGKSFLITGATGYIGSMIVRFLLYCNEYRGWNSDIYAMIRNIEKANDIFGEVDSSKLKYVIHELGTGNNIDLEKADFIIHSAAVTNSKQMVSNPVNVIKTSVNGTQEILDLAVKVNSRGVVYISSMEVYGKVESHKLSTESDLGYVDLSNTRSCYPESKRLCECLCTSYSSQYSLNVCVARLAQTFGVGILPGESRVFAQFANSVIENRDIILHTTGESEGNYVDISDAITGIFTLLKNGVSGESYNVANEKSHMSIRQMADLVAKDISQGKINVKIEIPDDIAIMGYAPSTKLFLSSEKLRKIGWTPKVELSETYKRMIEWMNLQ